MPDTALNTWTSSFNPDQTLCGKYNNYSHFQVRKFRDRKVSINHKTQSVIVTELPLQLNGQLHDASS